jgi:cell division septal protein FtsQ
LGHPWIAEAEISRIPPDQLNIVLKEHSPVALIRLDRTYIMNAAGEIFKTWTVSDPKQLPKIDGLEFEDLYIRGDEMSPPFKAVMDIIDLGKRKNSVLPNRKLSVIQVDRDSGITIYAYQNKTKIKLGYGGYPEKYKILSTVLSYLKRQSEFRAVRTIDLKKTDRIVVNPIRAGATGKDKKEV